MRKTFQDTFVPTSLLETCLYELERDKNDINIDNKLLIQKNAYLPNQFIAIYPDVCGKKIGKYTYHVKPSNNFISSY